MKKGLLFSVLILLLIGAGFWYFKLIPGLEIADDVDQTNPSDQENFGELIIEPEIEKSVPARPVGENSELKALAEKIIASPIVIKAQLSDSLKKQATDKLNETISAIRENYDYPNAWYDLGAYRKLIGDYDGAIDAWSFIGLIRPNDYIIYNNLGDLYSFVLKDYAKGESNFLKAISNNPANINGYTQLATLYEYAYKEKSAQAESILLLGIKSNPKDVGLKITLAQYYERNNRIADALKYFEEAAKLDPANKLLQEEVDRLKNS